MDKIKTITEKEEDKYSEIPDWSNEFVSDSEAAVLLWFENSHLGSNEIWFPYSQLRKSEDGLSVYASNWILEKKGW